MIEKILADVSRAIDLLSGGITWIVLCSFGGASVEYLNARAYGRDMRTGDLIAAYIVAICFGAMAWVSSSSLTDSESYRVTFTMASCLFGRECGPLCKEHLMGMWGRFLGKR